jgi:hypothetical protein
MPHKEDSTTPEPLNVAPSQEWNGNDGNWSTFIVRVGTPEQMFNVLPASATGEILVPIAECNEDDSPACSNPDGGVLPGRSGARFKQSLSSTWKQIGLFALGLESELNYTGNGMYGLDNVGLAVQNSEGPVLSDQVVGAISSKDFNLGLLGLSPRPSNFSDFKFPQRSFLTSLKDAGKIPSLSYGYTAGAWYSMFSN